jgi:hypothetical protein
MPNGDVLHFGAVFEPEIPNIDVSRFGPRGGTSVSLECDHALVVLLKHVVNHVVSLQAHEKLYPNGVWKIVARHEFCFCGALCI